jgi:hypothetical protein
MRDWPDHFDPQKLTIYIVRKWNRRGRLHFNFNAIQVQWLEGLRFWTTQNHAAFRLRAKNNLKQASKQSTSYSLNLYLTVYCWRLICLRVLEVAQRWWWKAVTWFPGVLAQLQSMAEISPAVCRLYVNISIFYIEANKPHQKKIKCNSHSWRFRPFWAAFKHWLSCPP